MLLLLAAGWMFRGLTPIGARFSEPVQTGQRPTHTPIWTVPALFVAGNAAETWRCPPTALKRLPSVPVWDAMG